MASLFGASLWGGSGSGKTGPPEGIPIQPLLYAALRLSGVTRLPDLTYKIPSPDQIGDAILFGNLMISQAKLKRYMVFTEKLDTYVLGTAESYTLGPGGTLSDPSGLSVRPVRIDRARLILSTTGTPVHLQVFNGTFREFSDLVVQQIPGAIPRFLYCDYNFPTATLYLVPQDQGGDLLELYSWAPIQQVQTAADLVAWPEGYDDWYVCNLAVRLASVFKLDIPEDVRMEASRTTRAIQSRNSQSPTTSSNDPFTGRRGSGYFNYYSGTDV